ncbi:MAG: hypothetical protein COB73_01495 [Flavobacteriaceae bacterium]|nr:MAG: hypothetical protein COB73_01495 [Flavobacteriaceae bacterium]
MIQRIQTLYLTIAILVMSILPIYLSIWKNLDAVDIYVYDLLNSDSWMFKSLPILFGLSVLISLITIFKFKNRQTQFVLGRLNILTNFIMLVLLVIHLQNLSGEVFISEKGIGSTLPLITIVLLVLANKAIKKDEDLVKSVDRIR